MFIWNFVFVFTFGITSGNLAAYFQDTLYIYTGCNKNGAWLYIFGFYTKKAKNVALHFFFIPLLLALVGLFVFFTKFIISFEPLKVLFRNVSYFMATLMMFWYFISSFYLLPFQNGDHVCFSKLNNLKTLIIIKNLSESKKFFLFIPKIMA